MPRNSSADVKTSTVPEKDPRQTEKGAEAIHAYIRRFAFWQRFPQPLRMIVAMLIGLLLMVVGTIMLFTPGQGVLTILAGLAVLGTEFYWARHSVTWCYKQGVRGWESLKQWWNPKRTESIESSSADTDKN